MIETTYDPLCETFHFASRNIGFVFAAFGPVEARNKMAKFTPGASALAALGVASLGRAVG
jgi:hypothetical protein